MLEHMVPQGVADGACRNWEGHWGREHLQTSTRPFASGTDLLQLDVMFQLLTSCF